MASSRSRVVATSLVLLTVLGAVSTLPVSALEPVSNSTYTRPSAPGATSEFRATVIAEENDSITQNGLESMTIDFSADPDYSGSVADVTARDVEIRVSAPNGNGTVPAGPVRVSANPAGDQLTVTLLSAYQNVQAGDAISIRADGVRNTEIAISNPQSLRGFAVDLSTSGPQGGTDGPVEAQYTIDPNATAQNATTESPSEQNMTDGEANGSNGSMMGTETGTGTAMTNATQTDSEPMMTSAMASESTTTTAASTTTTAESTTTAASDSAGGDSQTTTGASGPGFGLVGAVLALLAVSLLAVRRRD